MIIVGVACVRMRDIPAVKMIGQGVRHFVFFVFGHVLVGRCAYGTMCLLGNVLIG
jgi:hypothetical protein